MKTTFLDELKAIISNWEIWLMLGTQDIKLRYRRSTIGPLWITISMAVTIGCMGVLYGHLFKVALNNYFPYLAAGIISWSFISMLILESNNAFIDAEKYIRNQQTFMSLFLARIILRNTLIFAHNLLVLIPIIFIFHIGISTKMLLLIPGLIILSINALFWGTLLAILGTRYRDFTQIINSIVQIIFFITPVMWMPSSLPTRLQWLIEFNPFNQFLNLIRVPMMNQLISFNNLLIIVAVTILGFLLYIPVINNYKHRIVFWL